MYRIITDDECSRREALITSTIAILVLGQGLINMLWPTPDTRLILRLTAALLKRLRKYQLVIVVLEHR